MRQIENGFLRKALVNFCAQADQKYLHPFWAPGQWESLDPTLYRLDVISENTEPQGFILCQLPPHHHQAHLVKMLLVPEARGKGLALWALGQISQELRNLKVQEVYLEVEISNTRAVELYSKWGMSSLQILKNFYGPGRDGKSMMIFL